MESGIELSFDVTEQERQAILQPLRDYNISHCGKNPFETFGLLLRDPVSQEVVGGLYGQISYGWMFIELLSVPESMRTQGTGSHLMRSADALAREKGCAGIWLDTFSFQAQPFYERLGFTVFGVQENFPPGYRCVYLRKAFDGPAMAMAAE